MKLKVKGSHWSTGRLIAVINRNTAKKSKISINDRLLISTSEKEVVATLDFSSKLVGPNQILLSTEIIDYLDLKENCFVSVAPANKTNAIKIINKKLEGNALTESELREIVEAIVNNSLTEPEIAFFISSVYNKGMNFNEIGYFTKAIFDTGEKLNLNNKFVVDKHCIGGIAGNRTTPLVVAICASEGLIFPKTSSRAITSAAGTADVMEAICKVDFEKEELKKIIKKTNACLAWGGSLGFAPADDKIIKIEKLIHIDPEPNLISSILAKKLSVGSKFVLIDIPYGDSAKVSKRKGEHLKEIFEKLGKRFNMKLKCVLTKGDQPIGNGIGPILELRDIIAVLNGDGPDDLRKKVIFLSGQIFELCGKSKKGKGEKLAEELLMSGKALKKFYEIIDAQGGDVKNLTKTLELSKFSFEVKSHRDGKIKSLNNKEINLLGRVAGSPIDKKAGVYLNKHVGDKIKKNETVMLVYAESGKKLEEAKKFSSDMDLFKIE